MERAARKAEECWHSDIISKLEQQECKRACLLGSDRCAIQTPYTSVENQRGHKSNAANSRRRRRRRIRSTLPMCTPTQATADSGALQGWAGDGGAVSLRIFVCISDFMHLVHPLIVYLEARCVFPCSLPAGALIRTYTSDSGLLVKVERRRAQNKITELPHTSMLFWIRSAHKQSTMV